MEIPNTQNKMTVVYLVSGANKPVVPVSDRKMTFSGTSDPSSAMRSDRYPVPDSAETRFDSRERDLDYA